MDKPDKETQAVAREGEHIARFVESEDWQTVKKKFTDKIMDLQSVLNVNAEGTNLLVDVLSRKAAVTLLFEAIQDVEGIALQHRTQTEPATKVETEELIHNEA